MKNEMLLAYYAIRCMVELLRLDVNMSLVDLSIYSGILLNSRILSNEEISLKPTASKQEICGFLDKIESGQEVLWGCMLDTRRKQFYLETLLQKNQDKIKTQLQSVEISVPSELSTANTESELIKNIEFPTAAKPIKKRFVSTFDQLTHNIQPVISKIHEDNRLRIIEAHMYATAPPPLHESKLKLTLPQEKVSNIPISPPAPSPKAFKIISSFLKSTLPDIKPTTSAESSEQCSDVKGKFEFPDDTKKKSSFSDKVKTPIIDSINYARNTVAPSYTSPVESPLWFKVQEKIKLNRSIMIQEIRRRKLNRLKVWNDLGDQYLIHKHVWKHRRGRAGDIDQEELNIGHFSVSSINASNIRNSDRLYGSSSSGSSSINGSISMGRTSINSMSIDHEQMLVGDEYKDTPISQKPFSSLDDKLPYVIAEPTPMLSPWLSTASVSVPMQSSIKVYMMFYLYTYLSF